MSNTNIAASTGPQIKTSIIIQLVNEATQEIEHEQEETNVITITGITDQALNGGIGTPRIWISDRVMSKTPAFVDAVGRISGLEVASLTPTTFSTVIPSTQSTPYLTEYKCQFAAPTTTRTINTLGLMNGASFANYPAASIVALTTPCTQVGTTPGPGQSLVVTYRIQILASAAPAGTIPQACSTDRYWCEQFAGFNYTSDGLASIRQSVGNGGLADGVWNTNVPANVGVFVMPASHAAANMSPSYYTNVTTINGIIGANSSTLTSTNQFWQRYGAVVHDISIPANYKVGQLMGSIVYGTSSAIWNSNSGIVGLYASPVTSVGWQPVQNIFGHAATGTEPFQQVSALATGTGVVNASGASWTNPSWPEYYRINIATSGAVLTSRYSFAKRCLSGFSTNPSGSGTGSSYTTATAPVLTMPIVKEASIQCGNGVVDQTITATGDFHYNKVHPCYAEPAVRTITRVNGTSVATFDSTGVTLYDIKAHSYTSWDAATTPALPATSIGSIAVDSTSNIWVACRLTGLWRINTVSNTITQFTTFGTLTTPNVYAVSVGINNTIVIIVEGGVYASTNGGTTWTQQSFTYTGISDAKWSRVLWMRVQPNSPTLRTFIMSTPDNGTSANITWWSTASPTALTGMALSSSYFNAAVSSRVTMTMPRLLSVSKTGGVWMLATSLGRYMLTYGTNTSTLVYSGTQSSLYATYAEDPTYDYYGTPYFGGTINDNNTENVGYTVVDGSNTARGRWQGIGAYAGTAMKPYVELSDGICLSPPTYSSGQQGGMNIWSPAPNFSYVEGALTTRQSYNLQDTHFEEFVWDHYRWNGTAWAKGYHAPALDTAGAAGGPFNGTRHRFRTESHTFTGRSGIVVPAAVSASFFTNALTFAVDATHQAALAGQPANAQLFTWVDTATGNHIRFYLNNGSTQTSIVVNGTSYVFGATPTYGVATTFILAINGTSASCYVNGAQLGTTQTIPALNFGSATGEFVIGGNRVQVVDDVGFPRATDFYRGTMLNVLLDSASWAAGTVASYQAAPTTYTTATTRVRYQLNDSLSGLETKATHTTSDALLNGVTVRFTDGTGTSFVASEYYTFGVYNGILKDNATTFSHRSAVHYLPTTFNFTDVDAAAVPATTTVVTEPVCYRNYAESNTMYSPPGYVPITTAGSTRYSLQSIPGDFTYTGTVANSRVATDTTSYNFHFGVNDTTTTFTGNTGKWAMCLNAGTGNIDIYYGNSVVAAGVSAWAQGDTIAIQRSAGVFTFKRNGVAIYTTSGAQNYTGMVYLTANLPSWATTQYYYVFVHYATVTYDRPAYVVGIGNPTTHTGKYDPSFYNVIAVKPTDITVNISGYGTPATVTIAAVNVPMSTITAAPPAANNVIVVPDAGYILFNSADAGKAFTISCGLLKYNYN